MALGPASASPSMRGTRRRRRAREGTGAWRGRVNVVTASNTLPIRVTLTSRALVTCERTWVWDAGAAVSACWSAVGAAVSAAQCGRDARTHGTSPETHAATRVGGRVSFENREFETRDARLLHRPD